MYSAWCFGEWVGKANRNKLFFTCEDPRSSTAIPHCLHPEMLVCCIHSQWSTLQALCSQRLYSFLFQLEKWGREGSEPGSWLGLKMWSLEFCYCSFLSPGKNCQAVRMKQTHSSWPKLLPLFLMNWCLQTQIHTVLCTLSFCSPSRELARLCHVKLCKDSTLLLLPEVSRKCSSCPSSLLFRCLLLS